MLVTINTDASFWHHQQKGSWAFWAVCNKFKITKCGVFRESIRNSSEAELKCMINAVFCVIKAEPGITKIILNTDSQICMKAIKRQNPNSSLCKFVTIFVNMTKHIPIEFRHVKAHSKVKDARSYVNDWCDKNARKALKESVKKKKI